MMEALGVPSTFGFPFFLPNKLAFRRLPPPPTFFHSPPPPPYLSYTLPPQRHGDRRLAIPCAAQPAQPVSVEDEARGILRDFLKQDDSLRSALEEQKALEIVELLSSKLRSFHKSEQQRGVQLTQPQLIDLFTPYLTSILKENDNDTRIIGEDGQLPTTAPVVEREVGEAQTPWRTKNRQAIAQLEMQLSEGFPPAHVLCLMNLGLDLSQIRSMVWLYPSAASAAEKQKLAQLIEFLRSFGVSESDVLQVLHKCPQLICSNIEETIMPSMALLESKGLDKKQWPKIINRCPTVLMIGKAKIEALVGYFSEVGLSPTEIGRVLTHTPQVLCYSIEAKIKPTNRFLLDIGFTMEEIHSMLPKLTCLYNLNLERNLKPKWEFWLTMGYPKSELLKYPTYFSYSLERRIKPRYELATKHGIRYSLSFLLVASNADFENTVQREMHHVD